MGHPIPDADSIAMNPRFSFRRFTYRSGSIVIVDDISDFDSLVPFTSLFTPSRQKRFLLRVFHLHNLCRPKMVSKCLSQFGVIDQSDSFDYDFCLKTQLIPSGGSRFVQTFLLQFFLTENLKMNSERIQNSTEKFLVLSFEFGLTDFSFHSIQFISHMETTL